MKEIVRELEPKKQVHKTAGNSLFNPSPRFTLKGTRKTIPDDFFDRQSIATTTRPNSEPKHTQQSEQSYLQYPAFQDRIRSED